MRIEVVYEVKHRNAISLIEIDDLSFQVRPRILTLTSGNRVY